MYPDPFDDNNPININQSLTFRFIQAHLNMTGKVLDIGCENGRLLHLFKNAGWSTKGLELSPFLAQSIKDTLDIEVETANFLEHHPADEGTYDLVILRHVLEHLPDPIKAMTKIYAYLKPNGYAVLEFPNIEALDLKIKRLLQRLKLYQKNIKRISRRVTVMSIQNVHLPIWPQKPALNSKSGKPILISRCVILFITT